MTLGTAFLRRLFDVAVARAQPSRVLPAHLPAPPAGRTVVVGAGKASAAMARAVEERWPGELSGLVSTREGHGVPCDRVEIVEAAHPVPDERGVRAAARILELARGVGEDDLLLCLISGGGSSLLALPAPGLTLADKQSVGRALLASGAAIDEINTVRKHLSAIKGGRLAVAAHPARVCALLISDVPGDDPSVIASGPTVADATTFADARAVLAKYAIGEPARVLEHLRRAHDETPKPGDPRLSLVQNVLVATPRASLEAAAELARAEGVRVVMLGDAIEGEARSVGREQAMQALSERRGSGGPVVILSGGETTVTVRRPGRGGRNLEFLAGLALGLDGAPGVLALAADTDGVDGTEDNAGGVLTPDTLDRARALGLDLARALDENDTYPLFAALGDLVMTGPTLTNVNDFRAILVG
ncbi:MAG: glycerate kinase [Polyangiaceae bacterium]|nr:glycerate kinase [Polyangiaceae bacterium]